VKPLTTTSYAILGLLAIKPWTTYELAKQMEGSLRNFWPRAERKLYEEPRKLVAHQLATVQHGTVGKRPPIGLPDHTSWPRRAARVAG
jgi:DNA-binding PadR family transcriptional regulator